MRVYIIGNDGIALCRETPTAVNDGEIAVASSAELHAAALSGKRLLALWNALPGVEKRKKVGDRDALVVRQYRPAGLGFRHDNHRKSKPAGLPELSCHSLAPAIRRI